jgi:hypothetical protein
MQIRTRSIAGCKHECERHRAPGCQFDGHRMVCSLQPCDRTIKIVGSIERRFRYTSGTCKAVLPANTQTPCACANPLRPLPSPDLLAEPSRPRMLRKCGLQVRKYWGRKLFRKTTRRRNATSKRTSFTEPLPTSEKFEFLNCLPHTEIYALPRKSFFLTPRKN